MAATSYDQAAELQRTIGNNLLKFMLDCPMTPQLILDLGGGTGYLANALSKQYSAPVCNLDFAEKMLLTAKANYPDIHHHCANFNDAPFACDTFDLIFSNMSLQWSLNISKTLQEINRLTVREGYIALTMLGNATLMELRSCWQQIDGDHHVNDFIDSGAVLPLLKQYNFNVLFLKRQIHQQFFIDFLSILKNLKNLGANYVLNKNTQCLFGKEKFKRLILNYENFRQVNNSLPVTYEVFYIIAQKQY